jgi:glutamine synthetase
MLRRQMDAPAERGLQANVAVVLEFYLLADGAGPPRPVRLAQPGDGINPPHTGNVLSIETLDEQESFMNDLLRACFLAKPFSDAAGSGMHVHVCLNDDQGKPFFAEKDSTPAPAPLHAVGGLLASMPDTMLLAAPHANSYCRFRRNSQVLMTAAWGWCDRTAADRFQSTGVRRSCASSGPTSSPDISATRCGK